MDPNTPRAEAERWLGISEKLLASRDLVGSRSFAIRSRESDPTNPITDQILAVVDTLIAAEKRVINSGHHDWYSILQLSHLVRDPDLIASHYRRLVVLLNPEHNHLPFADFAIRFVFDAWSVLSDPNKKWMYDSELSIFLQRSSAPPDPEPTVRINSSAATYQFFQQPPPPQQQPQEHQQQQWIHQLHQHEQPQSQLQERQLFHQQHHHQPQPPPPPPPLQSQSQWLPQTQSQLQQLLPEHQRPSQSQWLPQPQQPRPSHPLQQPPQWPPERQRSPPQPQPPPKEPQIPQFQGQQPQPPQPPQQHQPQQKQQRKKTPPPPPPVQTTPPHRPLQPPPPQPHQPPPQQPSQPPPQPPPPQQAQREIDARRKEEGIGRASNVTNERAIENGNKKKDCNGSANVIDNDSSHDEGEQIESFWTACPYCYYLYEYSKTYQDYALRCQNCRRAFQAVHIPNPPGTGDESSFCSWGFFPVGFSMTNWKKSMPNNVNGFGSNWMPFSPMFACPVQEAKKKVWTIVDASDDDVGFSDSSDDSDSSGDWGSNRKKAKRGNGRSKRGRPGRKSNAEREKMANQHSVDGKNLQVQRNDVGINNNKAVATGSLRKQIGKGVRGRKKLDLNVEFSNEVEDHAPVTRGGNGEEVEFFEGLDEFLSTLPILHVVGDDKAKAS